MNHISIINLKRAHTVSSMKAYIKEYYCVLRGFQKSHIEYVLIKFPHLIKKSFSDLDILLFDHGYWPAIKLLQKQGFIIYRSEKYFEKYKTVLIKHVERQGFIKIHLHRRIAWDGKIIIDARTVFRYKKNIYGPVFAPRDEDELLIGAGHVIFEHFRIEEYDKKLILFLLGRKLNWDYINMQLDKFAWKADFSYLLDCITKNSEFKAGFWNRCRQFLHVGWLARAANLRRTGGVICLLGVDGAGKTSTARAVVDRFRCFEKQSYVQYIGWKPFLPSSRIIHFIGSLLKRKEPQLMKGYRRPKKCGFLGELIFCHFFLEHLSRYYFEIYPKLRRTHLLVADRYFYDVLAQDPRAGRSRILRYLIRLFPRPDFIFFLDNESEIIFKRKKEFQVTELQRQREQYFKLCEYIPINIIKTSVPVKKVANQIIERSWKKLINKMKW